MTDVGMALATGCDCPAWPAEVERDCCCIGGTECVDGSRRPGQFDAPTFDHPLTNDCIGGGCEECENAEAPTPSDAEVGAVSAIADHSSDSISGPPAIPAAAADGDAQPVDTAESRQTLQGPTVEAAGAARSSYLSGVSAPEVRLIHTLAVARLSLADDPAAFIEAACAVADLFPVNVCLGCDKTFVPVYRRQTKFCSDRCRYRIGMRNRRSRLAQAGPVSPVTPSHEDAK